MSRSLYTLLALRIPLALADCSDQPQSAGQIGGEGLGCLPTKTLDLGLDEPSPLGFSAAEVLAGVGQSHSVPLAWAKGGSTDLTVSLQYMGGAVRYLDREWKDDGSGMEIEREDCPDVVEIASTLSFATLDGAFAESWPIKALAPTLQSASVSMIIQVDALQGSYQVTEVDPATFDEVRVFLDTELAADSVQGTILGQGSKCDGAG